MKLNDVYSKPIEEIIKEMKLSDVKIHNSGERLISIELKYEVEDKDDNTSNKKKGYR